MTPDEAIERIVFGKRKRPHENGGSGSGGGIFDEASTRDYYFDNITAPMSAYRNGATTTLSARKLLHEMANEIDDVFYSVRRTNMTNMSSSETSATKSSSTNGQTGDPTEEVGMKIEQFLRHRWSNFDNINGLYYDKGENTGDTNGGNGGEEDNNESASLPWTSRVDCMLALWITCLGKYGRLTNNNYMKNGVRHEDGHRILPCAFSPEGCTRFPFFVDRILVRLRAIGEENRVENGGYDEDGLVSLEAKCLALILQNAIDSVMLYESERLDLAEKSNEWYTIFYAFVTKGKGNLTSLRDIMALHEAVRPLILYSGNSLLDPQQQQRFQSHLVADEKVGGGEEWAIDLLFAATRDAEARPSLLESIVKRGVDHMYTNGHESTLASRPAMTASCPPPLFPSVGSDILLIVTPAEKEAGVQSSSVGPEFERVNLMSLGKDDNEGITDDGPTNGSTRGDVDDGIGGSTDESVAEIIEIVKNRAFLAPLPPPMERKVLYFLSCVDAVDGETDFEEVVEPRRRGGRKGKSRSSRTTQDNDAIVATMAVGCRAPRWGKQHQRAVQLVFNEMGFTPRSLPQLVDKNPIVAIECLVLILTAPEDQDDFGVDPEIKSQYLSALAGMDMSIHSMEVVNRLASHSAIGGGGGGNESIESLLHPEYIHLYISTCISSCEGMSYDRHLQNKSVRLLCVFMQSLIRNGIVGVEVSLDSFLFVSERQPLASPFPVSIKHKHIVNLHTGLIRRSSSILHRVLPDTRGSDFVSDTQKQLCKR